MKRELVCRNCHAKQETIIHSVCLAARERFDFRLGISICPSILICDSCGGDLPLGSWMVAHSSWADGLSPAAEALAWHDRYMRDGTPDEAFQLALEIAKL